MEKYALFETAAEAEAYQAEMVQFRKAIDPGIDKGVDYMVVQPINGPYTHLFAVTLFDERVPVAEVVVDTLVPVQVDEGEGKFNGKGA